MHCVGYCLLGFLLLGSLLAVILGGNGSSKKLSMTLDSVQLEKFGKIRKHRWNLFVQGLLIGLCVAVLYYVVFGSQNSCVLNACFLTASVLGISYLYYMLMPKELILTSLNKPEQVQAWTDMYQDYQYRSSLGMALGVGGFFLLSWGTNMFMRE